MDDLRWILTLVGIVIVVAIYFSSRFEQEEWKRDREGDVRQTKPPIPKKARPENISRSQVENKSTITTIKSTAPDPGENKISSAVKEPPPSPSQQKNSSARSASVGLNSEADVKRVLDMGVPEASAVEENTNGSNGGWEGVVESARQPLLEDEIVAVEIPPELSEIDEKPAESTKLRFKPEVEEPVQQELVLDVEPLVLILAVMAKNENQYAGVTVQQVLEEEGLKHGDMEIFHYHVDETKDPVFSVASIVEPGIFDLKTISELTTPGITLFCQLPGPVASKEAFEILLEKARNIASKLDGQLCDDKRNKLTDQACSHYRDKIDAFDHEMLLARKKQE